MKLSPLGIAVISTSFAACHGHLRGNPRHIQKELFSPGGQPSFAAVATPLPDDHRRRLQEMASLEEGKDSSDDKTKLPPPAYFRPDPIIGWGIPPVKKEPSPGK
jgi:hypothetical protein